MDATPSEAGFLDFIRNYAGISTGVLPDDSTYITFAYDVASTTVNEEIGKIPGLDYALATYNLGIDVLINYALDVSGSTYFSSLRSKFDTSSFTAGVMTGAGDAGTAGSIAVSDALQQLTLSDLQNLKTPWGRAYLAIAQKYGTPWGIS
jgi:hypothetical protein